MQFAHEENKLRAMFSGFRHLTQMQSCVVDLLAAREAVTDQLDHLDNAQTNLAEFVGPGEDRWITIGDAVHNVGNVDGTITVTPYIRTATDATDDI